MIVLFICKLLGIRHCALRPELMFCVFMLLLGYFGLISSVNYWIVSAVLLRRLVIYFRFGGYLSEFVSGDLYNSTWIGI